MDHKQPKLSFSTIQITKAVDEGSFIPVEQVILELFRQETGDDKKHRYRNNSGLSTIYNVTYVQLSQDKKVLILGIEDRKALPKTTSPTLRQEALEPPTSRTSSKQQNKNVIQLLKEYQKIKNQKAQQGFSFKKAFQKYSDQKYCNARIQQLCKQLDGQPFLIYKLGIVEERNSICQLEHIYSVTFLNMCGRNIIQQSLNISQSKTLPEFHTKHNYKKQIQTVLSYCISRIKNPSTSDDMNTKAQLAFQLDKQIIKRDGQILPVKTKLYFVNPLMFYVIQQIVQSSQTKKYDSSIANFTFKNPTEQSVSFKDIFRFLPHASYKNKQQDQTNNIEIISKVHKN